MKILAVDDDEIALEILKSALVNADYTDITVATSADEALALINNTQDPFDCYLLDIRMPGKDGIELCKTIRSFEEYINIPVLMITALSEQCYIDRAFAAGATDYITKPFHGLELGARIRAADGLSHVVHQEREARLNAEALKEQLDGLHSLRLDEKFDLEDVTGAVDITELENRLLKLPMGNYAMEIVAFKIIEIETIHQTLSSSDFRSLVNSVASCITGAINSPNLQISYVGDGIFVCVIPKSGRKKSSNVATKVKSAVGELEFSDTEGNPITIDVAMGKPSHANLWSSQEAPVGLENAIKRANLNGIDQKAQSNLTSLKNGKEKGPRRHSRPLSMIVPIFKSRLPLMQANGFERR